MEILIGTTLVTIRIYGGVRAGYMVNIFSTYSKEIILNGAMVSQSTVSHYSSPALQLASLEVTVSLAQLLFHC